MSKKTSLVGIIAEDDSDVESIRLLIKRISGKENIGAKKFVGKGCGKIKRKCSAWANQLKQKGCGVLIVVHDLDRNQEGILRKQIIDSLVPNPFSKWLVSIPTEELEAWLLSDSNAIKDALKLRKMPDNIHHPETVISPKEHLGSIVEKCSDDTVVYINTKHNSKIVEKIDVSQISIKCPSFVSFHDFISEHF
ncbi:DUF4276 family protein [Pelotalea chapellei]|uniref:DUF4276 family protein n=1 Tax=Pelotalea chapellei TaxID=44671 RepID=A0ABS5U5Y4_9BACT|nr:DUF4276 family protein [Pelotalea chapellei]MBT1071072.1 DUF4276 family protein [Pelotalea chapellei]